MDRWTLKEVAGSRVMLSFFHSIQFNFIVKLAWQNAANEQNIKWTTSYTNSAQQSTIGYAKQSSAGHHILMDEPRHKVWCAKLPLVQWREDRQCCDVSASSSIPALGFWSECGRIAPRQRTLWQHTRLPHAANQNNIWSISLPVSARTGTSVPRCRLSTYGCRAFHYAGPAVWNSMPDELRNLDSFDSFARFLKTILFSRY